MPETVAIRDAATLILLRDPGGRPSVLMGQRGAGAVFMPNKFVFPGGAVDPEDALVPLDALPAPCECARLLLECRRPLAPSALAAAAIRELREETGLFLARPGSWAQTATATDRPLSGVWKDFAAAGLRPDASGLRFVFRALTPPGRPRRFDARFFLVVAEDNIHGDPEDFSAASGELSALQWVPLEAARSFDLPFITEVVLAEVAAALPHIASPTAVPFFDQQDGRQVFHRLCESGSGARVGHWA